MKTPNKKNSHTADESNDISGKIRPSIQRLSLEEKFVDYALQLDKETKMYVLTAFKKKGERKASLRILNALLKNGYSSNDIIKITSISEKRINQQKSKITCTSSRERAGCAILKRYLQAGHM